MQLDHVIKADGRWRLFSFAGQGDPTDTCSGLAALCDLLGSASGSPVLRYTPDGADIDSVIDVRAVLQQGHRDVDLFAMHPFLKPNKGRHGLVDYEKIFCSDLKSGQDVFALLGIDRAQGCLVVVRPDQFVAQVLPLNATDALGAFFERFMIATRS